MSHRFPNISDKVTFKDPPKNSVGKAAILSSLQHMRRYMDWPEALKASLKMNQKEGFDCAGCAWPDPDDERSSIGEYCENGIKALAEEATPAKADPAFWARHSIEDLLAWTEFDLGKAGRITHPMVLRSGATHYEEVDWEEAFEMIADEIMSYDDPNKAIFYTSGRTSNEAAFLYGTLARVLGTNNLPDCSNMCHETSGRGLSETLGIGKGSVTLEDIYQSDLIMVIGQNPGTNHPRMLTALEKCKQNGGKIISVNPLKETGLIKYTNPQKPLRLLSGGVDITDLYLQVRTNGDIALLKGIMHLLLKADVDMGGVVDHDFIEQYTDGWEAVKTSLEEVDLNRCVQDSGISEEEIRKATQMIIESKSMIICWAMGITQHENGVQNVREIVNLLLMRGAIGRAGSGVCPVRGHSNVQGDRTMGVWEKMPDAFIDKLSAAFETDLPKKHGYSTVEAIKAMDEEKASFFMGMGGNFISAVPDTDRCAKGLRQCNLTVHVSTKPNRSHLVHGQTALILPVLGRSEIDVQASGYQFVSTENSMGIVQNSKGVLEPKSSALKSEVAVICGIGKALAKRGRGSKIDWQGMEDDYDLIRNKIEEVIPGFENYNTRVRHSTGFYLPNGVKQRDFKTNNGKAHFTINPLPNLERPARTYILGTVRSHDQYNTTLYGLDDRYRGIKNGRNIILMHPEDLKKEGIKALDKVDLHSEFKGEQRSVYQFKVIPYDIPRGCLMGYFPELNPLVPIDQISPEAHTPASKSIVVTLNKNS
jgi:molybdopterin-dependent oxidoreductase alpha subunit